ncbi:MAG: DNA-processing protein DprA [Luteolibacter sp.]
MSPLEAQVALNMLTGIGPVRCRRLIRHFGSALQVLEAEYRSLLEVEGIGKELAKTVTDWQKHADPVAEIKAAHAMGIRLITPEDPTFPPYLLEAYDAPLLLYCWGNIEAMDQQAIGVVGSRRCSHYGLHSSRKLTYQLASCGMTIISGLARGIDTSAHEAAIAAGGRTIAILGSGLGQLYPAENEALAQRIAGGHGAVISEYPLNTRPDRGTFPMRNRIIAAWAQALLVIECPDKSGSLITANLAAEYGRPVFVVPGYIDSKNFIGSHRLIRDGATLITDGSDVLEDLGGMHVPTPPPSAMQEARNSMLNADQSRILECIGNQCMTADELMEACDLSAATVTRSLTLLEIHGMIKSQPGATYAIT